MLGLQHFVDGDLNDLVRFAGDYAGVKPGDRYVVVNELGEGRMLARAPSVDRKTNTIRCAILPGCADRDRGCRARENPMLYPKPTTFSQAKRNWAEVSGVDALPQQIRTCMSHQKGESPFHRDFGAQLAEYWRDFSGTIWFSRLLKLEASRLASIPYSDPRTGTSYTPFQCAERVQSVALLAEAPTNNWLPIHVELDVKGLGRWAHDLSICVPPEVPERPAMFDMFTAPTVQHVTPSPVPPGLMPGGKDKWRVR